MFARTRHPAPEETGLPTLARPVSQLCTAAQFAEPDYARWCAAIGEPVRLHRKQWEFCYILRILETRGMLAPGRRGLGFGVGREPLVAAMAARGVAVTATDLSPEDARAQYWTASGEHASGLAMLNERGLCPPDAFARLVRYEAADMRAIDGRHAGYDFVWSSCAFEHLGSLDAGIGFVIAALGALRPGGIAVHTTEHNLDDGWRTRRGGATVLYRRRDLERLFAAARARGFSTRANWTAGDDPLDTHVDLPPYSPERHLKIGYRGFRVTSFGLVLEPDAGRPPPALS